LAVTKIIMIASSAMKMKTTEPPSLRFCAPWPRWTARGNFAHRVFMA
jgi:hypothetical protein